MTFSAWRPDLPGWSWDILEFYEAIAPTLRRGAEVAEIGVAWGRSVLFLAERLCALGNTSAKLWAIDPWERVSDVPHGARGPLVNEPLRALVHFARPAELALVRPVRATSEQAARLFREAVLDLVFVDGDHALDAVRVDLALWMGLVRPGGTLAGHDYLPHRFPEVVREVDALAERLGQRPTLRHTCWSFHL